MVHYLRLSDRTTRHNAYQTRTSSDLTPASATIVAAPGNHTLLCPFQHAFFIPTIDLPRNVTYHLTSKHKRSFCNISCVGYFCPPLLVPCRSCATRYFCDPTRLCAHGTSTVHASGPVARVLPGSSTTVVATSHNAWSWGAQPSLSQPLKSQVVCISRSAFSSSCVLGAYLPCIPTFFFYRRSLISLMQLQPSERLSTRRPSRPCLRRKSNHSGRTRSMQPRPTVSPHRLYHGPAVVRICSGFNHPRGHRF